MTTPAKGALAGVRVIDMSHQAAGPWCTTLLGDMGADVIKVEKAGRGDSIRHADRSGKLPPHIGGPNFQGLNRNKRGICVDIGEADGVALIRRLVTDADVFVENFRPGVMERKGLGYEDLRRINPRLVYCSITAFGETGPMAQKPGMDLILQATGGIMAHTGEEGGPPIKSAPPVADLNTGVYGAYAILGALFARERSGEGQRVHIAMLDAVLSLFADNAANVLIDGTRFGRFGSGHPDLVPYQAFQCRDGYLLAGATNDAAWRRFTAALDRNDLAVDERFLTNELRVENRGILVPLLEEALAAQTVDYWISRFATQGVAAAPIQTLDQVLAHPQVLANDMVVQTQTADGSEMPLLGAPFKLSNSSGTATRGVPPLGADTEEILTELKFDAAQIALLRAQQAV